MQQIDLGLEKGPFSMSMWVPLGFPPASQKHSGRRIGFDKLPIGIHECVNVFPVLDPP